VRRARRISAFFSKPTSNLTDVRQLAISQLISCRPGHTYASMCHAAAGTRSHDPRRFWKANTSSVSQASLCEPTGLGRHAFLADGSNALIAARDAFIRKLVATSDADLYRSRAQPSRRVQEQNRWLVSDPFHCESRQLATETRAVASISALTIRSLTTRYWVGRRSELKSFVFPATP
jgi:hypothetical protein